MIRSRFTQIAVAAAVCATTAAMIGIASGAAAPSKNAHRSAGMRGKVPGPPLAVFEFQGDAPPGGKLPRPPKGAMAHPLGGPPVHSEMVVPNKAGDGFITVTQDNGKVESASGDQVTITEGTPKATYKTVTVDVPSDAKIVRNGKQAELSDLQPGDQVHVSSAPDGSFVFASDASFTKQMTRNGRPLPPPPGFGGAIPGGPPPNMGLPAHRGGSNKH